MITIVSNNNLIEDTLNLNKLFAGHAILTRQTIPTSFDEDTLFILDDMEANDIRNVIKISNAGNADLKKPFHIKHLVKLISINLSNMSSVDIKGCRINFFEETIRNGNIIERLTAKEARLLEVLYSNTYLSKQELLEKIWNYNCNIDTGTLNTHIYNIRHKLEKIGIENLIKIEKDKYFLS